jgi:hypothetical protein
MDRIGFLDRFVIALKLIRGKMEGRYGPQSICPEFVNADGSTAFHRNGWELTVYSGAGLCTAMTRIKKNS